MAKVFSDYYKTKLADAAIKEEINGLEKDRKAYIEELQKAGDDYKKAIDEANNQAVSAEEREKRKKGLETKLKELKDGDETLKQFVSRSDAQLEQQMRRMMEEVITEIKVAVAAKGKAGGYTFVVDASAKSLSNAEVFLYNSGDADLTAAVIEQLNAAAPPEAAGASEKPVDKKDKK